MFRRALGFAVLLGLLGLAAVRGADGPAAPDRFARVDVAATRTSIYIGTVAMTMSAFTRDAGTYVASYEARVFPFFFASERGRLGVTISDAQLAQLGRGETIEFTGRAVNEQGDERRIEGRASPADAASGRLKVRVFVSRRIELIFNTTYRFPDVP